MEKKVTKSAGPRQCLLATPVTIPQAAPAGCGEPYLDRRSWYVPRMQKVRFCVAVATLVLLAGCERGPAPAIRLDTGDAQLLATGKAVYDRHCAACHGAKLEGQPNWRSRDTSGRLPAPPHDATGHTWHHPDEVLFNITKHGVAKTANLKDYQSAMPAYEGVLSDAEIVAVLSWIKSKWPAGIRDKQEQVNAAALKNKAAGGP